MHSRFLVISAISAIALSFTPLAASTTAGSHSARSLVVAPVNSDSTATVRGEVAVDIARSQDLGLRDANRSIELTIVLNRTPEQQAALDELRTHAHTSGDALFGQTLSGKSFGETFGASAHDFTAVSSWLTSSGLSITATDAARNTIMVRGTVSAIESAFGIGIHTYATPEGKQFYAAATSPKIPEALAPSIARIRGLQTAVPSAAPGNDELIGNGKASFPAGNSKTTQTSVSTPTVLTAQSPSSTVKVTLTWLGESAPTGTLHLAGPNGTRGDGTLGTADLSSCMHNLSAHTSACSVPATDAYSALPANGANSVRIVYSGDSTHSYSSSFTSLVVSDGSTTSTTTLTTGANPSISYGTTTAQSWAVTVKGGPGAAKPAGTVTVSQTSLGTIGSATVSTSCTASGTSTNRVYTCPASGTYTVPSSSAAGTYSNLTFTYGGSSTYASSKATTTLTITADATSTALSANPATILPDGSTMITATITNTTVASATPAGTVTFTKGNASLGSCTLAAGKCTATISGSLLVAGSNTVTATYTPSLGNWTTSNKTTTITVAKDSTSTTVTADPGSVSVPGQTVLTAVVKDTTNSTLTVTGSVYFEINGTLEGHCTLSGGSCTHAYAGRRFVAGQNTVTAIYEPSTDWSTSSGTTSVNIVPASSSTALSASPMSISSTGSSMITATVTTAFRRLTGTVAFQTGSTALGSCTLTNYTCSITVTGATLGAGNKVITGTFTPGTTVVTGSSGTTTVSVAADISFSSVTHNFGSWAAGGAGTTGTSDYGVQVTNQSASAIGFKVALSGSSAFTVFSNNCPVSLAVGKTCEIVFAFKPTVTGPASATWSLTSVTPGGLTYGPSNGGTLSGTGITASGLTITTNGHNFGVIATEATSPVFGAVITNGTASAVALSVGDTNAPFAIYLNNCPASLPAGGSCNLQWTFSPTDVGTVSTTVPLSASQTIYFGSTAVTGMYLAGTGQ